MTFQVYRRLTITGRQWFWRLRAANNRIIAIGGEAYRNKADVYAMIDKIAGMDAAIVKEI